MPFAPGEPNKLYGKEHKPDIMRVITGKLMVIYWENNPVDYKVLNIKDFDRLLKKEGWIQIN